VPSQRGSQCRGPAVPRLQAPEVSTASPVLLSTGLPVRQCLSFEPGVTEAGALRQATFLAITGHGRRARPRSAPFSVGDACGEIVRTLRTHRLPTTRGVYPAVSVTTRTAVIQVCSGVLGRPVNRYRSRCPRAGGRIPAPDSAHAIRQRSLFCLVDGVY
jgi:hypothetical protein